MKWKCPACEAQVRHDGDAPAPNRVYRCAVCRLELTLNPETNRMDVAPLPDAESRRRKSDKPRPA